ncbi:DUF5615 family PIN-like protein [Rhodoplanes azumiensis]|uniref:DUF5615 family PIN-like protein n=1 Tax=Rhodoplanes azumiensis TaxID=1897628 RepID=A0ABW5ASM3_9BRAD
MKILLDECIDWRLGRDLVGHDVTTARHMGWSTLKNGELLALASTAFDAFVTLDRNLPFQQNITVLPLRGFVLRPRSSRLVDLRPLAPMLLARLRSSEPGRVVLVGDDEPGAV